MKVLHILTGGQVGGIETLCREFGLHSKNEQAYCFMSFGGKIYEQMEKLGIKTYPLFLNSSKMSINKLLKLLKIARKYDVLVIHHEDPFIETYYFWTKILLRKKGVRYVHSCYDDKSQWDKNFIKHIIKRISRKISLNISDRVFVVSRAGYDSLLNSYRVDKKKIRIIYNGISDSYLEQGKNYKRKENNGTIEILYIGRLVGIKGVHLLINAISKLKSTYNIELSVVGYGEEKQALQELVYNLHLEDNVIFHGSQANITPYLENADIFVYPSTCQEVFGISIIEAMAYGKICVTNRVGGIPEVVEDEINGFLTKELSEDALVEAITKAIQLYKPENVERLQKMIDAARSTAYRFSIKNTCIKYDSELENKRGIRILMLVNWKVDYCNYPRSDKQPPDYYVYGEPYWFFRYFEEKPAVDVIDIHSFPLFEKFEKNVIRFYIIQGLRAIPKLGKYDMIVSHGMQSGLVVSVWRKFFPGREKHVVFDIGAFNSASEKGLALHLMQYFSKSIDSLVIHTSSQIDYYKDFYPWLVDKTKFIKFGTDYDFFTEGLRKIPVEKNEKNYCICIGHNKRDWDTVIDAYNIAKPVDLNLLLIGHVDNRYQDVDGVKQIGLVPIDELIYYIKNAKFCILPLKSYNYSYGQMTLMQQMLLGKCVITADVLSLRDYVDDGNTAILYESENVADLAEKIIIINENDRIREEIAHNAAEYIKTECNEKTMSKEIEKIIYSLC